LGDGNAYAGGKGDSNEKDENAIRQFSETISARTPSAAHEKGNKIPHPGGGMESIRRVAEEEVKEN
jgi:hypothetical protein